MDRINLAIVEPTEANLREAHDAERRLKDIERILKVRETAERAHGRGSNKELVDLLAGSGVEHLLGGYRDPAVFIKSMMSKQKRQPVPYNRQNVIRPFNADMVKNPSLDIQRKYKDEPFKRFDYLRAARNQDARDRAEEDDVARIMNRDNIGAEEAARRWLAETQKAKEVSRPEYWGLSWADLRREGNYWVNEDGLRFPPIKWRNPDTGREYYGLACCGGTPREGKNKIRYEMIYFKDDEMPDLSQFRFQRTSFQKAADRYRRVADRDPRLVTTDFRDPFQVDPELRDNKTYDGVNLRGTNRTLAKSEQQRTEARRVYDRTRAERLRDRRLARGGTKPKTTIDISDDKRTSIREAIDAAKGIITTTQKLKYKRQRGKKDKKSAAPRLEITEVEEEAEEEAPAPSPPRPPPKVRGPGDDLVVVSLTDSGRIDKKKKGTKYVIDKKTNNVYAYDELSKTARGDMFEGKWRVAEDEDFGDGQLDPYADEAAE